MRDKTFKIISEDVTKPGDVLFIQGLIGNSQSLLAVYDRTEGVESFTSPLVYEVSTAGTIRQNHTLLSTYAENVFVGREALIQVGNYLKQMSSSPNYGNIVSGVKAFLDKASELIDGRYEETPANLREQIISSEIEGTLEKLVAQNADREAVLRADNLDYFYASH